MSRSKHTRPQQILAASRIRAPFEPRAKSNFSSFRRSARALKESGISIDLGSPRTASPHYPRIIVNRARPDHLHPASKRDIENILAFFGDRCSYGLQAIKLVQGTATGDGKSLQWGRLQVPGTIVLYDQPISPWFISGSIGQVERAALVRAGAVVELHTGHCLVHWSESDLKNFMLFDVFMHEVGHHIIQQYKGKRAARVMRTKDHELFADTFARRCKLSYLAEREWSVDA